MAPAGEMQREEEDSGSIKGGLRMAVASIMSSLRSLAGEIVSAASSRKSKAAVSSRNRRQKECSLASSVARVRGAILRGG